MDADLCNCVDFLLKSSSVQIWALIIWRSRFGILTGRCISEIRGVESRVNKKRMTAVMDPRPWFGKKGQAGGDWAVVRKDLQVSIIPQIWDCVVALKWESFLGKRWCSGSRVFECRSHLWNNLALGVRKSEVSCKWSAGKNSRLESLDCWTGCHMGWNLVKWRCLSRVNLESIHC